MFKFLLLAILIAVIGLAAIIRVRPVDATAFHVDPASLVSDAENGPFTIADGGARDPVVVNTPISQTVTTLSIIIDETPRTRLVLGSLEDGLATYETRSLVFGFPDFTTIKLKEAPEGTEITAAAGQVYGILDFGVNKDRVSGWLLDLPN